MSLKRNRKNYWQKINNWRRILILSQINTGYRYRTFQTSVQVHIGCFIHRGKTFAKKKKTSQQMLQLMNMMTLVLQQKKTQICCNPKFCSVYLFKAHDAALQYYWKEFAEEK